MNRTSTWRRQWQVIREILQSAKSAEGKSLPSAARWRPACELLEGRLVPAGVRVDFAVTQDWGSGLQANVILTNTDSSPVNNWKLSFDYGATITSIWDAKISARSGSQYTIDNAGWNSTLAAGASVSFGFIASPASSGAVPTNYFLNGVAIGAPSNPKLPSISISDAALVEGNSGTSNLIFTVNLSSSSTSPVTVKYATADGTARSAADFTGVSGQLTFNPGETAKAIAVKVVGDTTVEADETFLLNLSDPSGANLSRAQATGTIKNDDQAPTPTSDATLSVTNDWGSGFNADVTVRNRGSAATTSWLLEFDFAGTITSIWNASIVSKTGNHFVVKNESWNGALVAGGSATFGFTATPATVGARPINFLFRPNGVGGTPGGTTPNRAPIAVDDLAGAQSGRATTIDVLKNDSDPDGDALQIASVTQGKFGVVAINANGTLNYTPLASFSGQDAFTYATNDGRGGTATAQVKVTVTQPALWPDRVYAPYVDMTLYPIYDLASATRSAGIKYFNLAFIVADPTLQPAWGGYAEYAVNGGAFDLQMRAQISAVRALGGDVAASFGGAANKELAEVITDVARLQAAYQKVVDAYGLTRIDFDIEGAAQADRVSVDRRSQAMAGLQQAAAAAGRRLDIWLTLPVLPTGLTADGLYIVQSAKKFGVAIAGVNIMAMDYGDSAAPNPQGKMGDYAIQAAQSLFTQLKGFYGTKTDAELWRMVGVTPMIGMNDIQSEIFDQTEARELAAFAQQKGIGMLSMWSLHRDKQNPKGTIGYVETTSSSITQNPFEFSQIFGSYTGA